MHKQHCPACRDQGRDTSGNNLTVYDDGHGFCHACNTYYFADQLQEQEMQEGSNKRSQQDKELELRMIQEYCVGHPLRPEIHQDVCEEYGMRYSTDGIGQPDSTFYLYRDNEGVVIDAKKKTSSKDFYCITGKVNRACLYGRHLIPDNRRRLIIVTEGEDDALAAKTMLRMLGRDYAVVSIQNGANVSDGKSVLDNALLREVPFLQEFDKVALCLDQDVPGEAYATALAEVLAPVCDVRLMKLPVKDAYDMLRAGLANEFFECLNNANRFTPEGVIEGRDVNLKDLKEAAAPGFSLPFNELQFKTHGLRKAEITLLTAGSGIGKTTIAREIGAHCVKKHSLTIGNIYLEEQWKKTAQGYIAIDHNVPLAQLRANPDMLTAEQWASSEALYLTSNKLHFFKHFGSVQSDALMQKMRYMALGLACDFIILDHITMVLSGNDSHDERKDIDILMTRLAELVVETGVGVIAVVHLRRTGQAVPFNSGGEVSLTDLRGSSQLEALSFNVWAAERDQQSESHGDILTLRVLKNREWGFTGLADKLFYNHETGRLVPVIL